MSNNKKRIYIDYVNWFDVQPGEIMGCFAKQDFLPGQTITKFNPVFIDSPSRTSIQIDASHMEDEFGMYLNHNCDPNAVVIVAKEPYLVCINNIEKGDEVTIDYNDTEDRLSHPFFCNCHHREIRGKNCID